MRQVAAGREETVSRSVARELCRLLSLDSDRIRVLSAQPPPPLLPPPAAQRAAARLRAVGGGRARALGPLPGGVGWVVREIGLRLGNPPNRRFGDWVAESAGWVGR